MEFLFTVDWASTESILVLACLVIFVGIFIYDGFIYTKRVFHLFEPKQIPTSEETEEKTLEELVGMPSTPDVNTENVTSIDTTVSSTIDEEGATTESINSIDTPIDDPELIDFSEEQNIKNTTGDAQNIEEDITHTETAPIEDIENGTTESTENKTVAQEDSVYLETQSEYSEEVDKEDITGDYQEAPVVEQGLPYESEKEENQEVYVGDIYTEKQEKTSSEESANHEDISGLNEDISETSPRNSQPNGEKVTHSETLFALVNNIRTLIARGQTLEARGLIIQGLALEKDNRELNMMLAGLYEQDRHFEKAEFIYKDLALQYPNDIEILEKLGNVLIIERRYEIALEMYKKILSLSGETEGTLYILAHLAHELGQHDFTYECGKKYQKRWPNNPEILTILAQAEVALGNRKDAIQTLIKLKNLTPYNQEITDMIGKLVMEEEMAGNFGN